MQILTSQPQPLAAIRTDLAAIFVSLELSQKTWLITSLSPGAVRRCQNIPCQPAILPGFWRASRNFRTRRLQGIPAAAATFSDLGIWVRLQVL
jgi:hypothetical protein